MRPHPLFICYDIKRWWILLLIPLVRLATIPFGGAVRWQDLLPAAVLLGWSVIQWCHTSYRFDHRLQIKSGVWFRRTLTLPSESTALIAVEASPLATLATPTTRTAPSWPVAIS